MKVTPGTNHRPNRDRRGAVSAELALVTSLVLLPITLGCADLGRFAYAYISVTNAARAGGSYAIMNNYTTSTLSAWNSAVASAAQAESSLAGVTVPSPTVTTDANGLRRVRVSASYQFRTLVNWPGIPSSLTLGRTVELRMIR